MPKPSAHGTRVWHQIQEAEYEAHRGDSVVRIALVTAALDPASALPEALRAWALGEMGQRTTPLTREERRKVRGPLLAWVAERMPGCYPIVKHQFSEETYE